MTQSNRTGSHSPLLHTTLTSSPTKTPSGASGNICVLVSTTNPIGNTFCTWDVTLTTLKGCINPIPKKRSAITSRTSVMYINLRIFITYQQGFESGHLAGNLVKRHRVEFPAIHAHIE